MNSDPLISRTIGNYEIVSRLGKGGMATVYRARQINMQRDVAIKIMSADLAEDPQFVARFEREAQVIANLQHPRILPVHDFGHDGDIFYLVMRVIEGESLYHRLLGGALPLATAAHYTNQIAEALDYAHAQGVVHRDLKPNNILIDEWDNLYLMDFGLAKMLAASQSLTQTGTVLGTPAYMAPEQWRGEQVDARTDVYSLGVILYEMVLGHTPFESDTPFTLMYKHINDAPPPLRDANPDLPEAIEGVIFKALAKDRNDRYQSAGELARAFTAVVQASGAPDAEALVPPKAKPATEDAALEEASGAALEDGSPDALPPVPQPAQIFPPPPPIPVPGGSSPRAPEPEARGREARRNRPSGAGEDAITGQPDVPDHGSRVSMRVRQAIDAVENTLEAAVEKAALAAPPLSGPSSDQLQPPVVAYHPSGMPVGAPAFDRMRDLLPPGEALVGVLDVRGTAEWQTWKHLLIGGFGLMIVGGMVNAGIISLLGLAAWFYLFIQLVRTWRGESGRYYLGFTPDQVVVLPRGGDSQSRLPDARSADWSVIERLRLTNRYVLLDMPTGGESTLHFAALVVAQGDGGLGDQAAWLPQSPIPPLIEDRGFEVRNL